ncbi:uncharacterized protein G2W53_014173 [Senna tora]|uniref:Uncharacterized protein n=1 Tax=Senna tora TaxID=362788 RepID=A0A835C5A8_9FABA|nr:uncharacterized protein G2W53_014173 [Senna tora]
MVKTHHSDEKAPATKPSQRGKKVPTYKDLGHPPSPHKEAFKKSPSIRLRAPTKVPTYKALGHP